MANIVVASLVLIPPAACINVFFFVLFCLWETMYIINVNVIHTILRTHTYII